jgi:hypothetical protein
LRKNSQSQPQKFKKKFNFNWTLKANQNSAWARGLEPFFLEMFIKTWPVQNSKFSPQSDFQSEIG